MTQIEPEPYNTDTNYFLVDGTENKNDELLDIWNDYKKKIWETGRKVGYVRGYHLPPNEQLVYAKRHGLDVIYSFRADDSMYFYMNIADKDVVVFED